MVGLWGHGGIGKTTLAKAIYNAIFREFEGSCFLDRVSENSKDLVHLQKELLSQVLRKELTVYNVDEGSPLIQDRLCNKKVLIILDDVDDECQLNALAGHCEWFGKGSRIIITTKNKHLLTSHGVYSNHLYKVTALKYGEALELFRKHAFPRSQKIEIRSNLIDSVLHYAEGLPLALEVLGCFLCGRGEHQWEETLKKLAKSPNPKINNVLKVSYDGLEDYLKKIFLDIACFFNGQTTRFIKEALDSCDFDTTIGIEILIERSLITEEGGTLRMHDLIKWMGMNTVKEECCDDASKRSRLWLYDDVLDVLSRDAGADATEAIALTLPNTKETYICPTAFKHMRKLRLLILHNRDNSFQGPIHLPNQLRWLQLSNCALIPEFGYGPIKLVGLCMRNSNIKEVPKQFKGCKMLKYINLSECNSLIRVPDVSSLPILERLDLDRCKSLVEVHESVGYLGKLEYLSLASCSNLRIFPSALKTKSLRNLNLFDCSKLEKFSEILEKIEHLEYLYLSGTAIKELPASIDNLVSVKYMQLRNCKSLARLPSSIYKLQNLGSLNLEGCSNFVHFTKNMEDSTDPNGCLGFPNLDWLELKGCNLLELEFLEDSSNFPKLRYLGLSGNKFTHMPTCLRKYDNLEYLYLYNCRQLQEIPQLPSNISIIKAKNCKSLQKLPEFSRVSNLDRVEFSSCCGLYCKEFSLGGASVLKYIRKAGSRNILLIGGEMPGWIQHCEEGSISFWVPKDLYDKVLGLALCMVLGLEEGKEVHASCEVQIFVNGKELLQKEWSHFQVDLRASNASIKKRGFRLICQQEEDDLRVELQCPQR
ncbi:hypothetical protein BT93_I0330 [Corymbia citriodora subsp. variegata]|nr:hypothetical protein BT93_I0330 [Corymbia citriodora subsp. variegata]